MLNKIYDFLHAIDESFMFSFFASIATALLKPQGTRWRTFIVFLGTTILGTLVGKAVETIPFLEPFKFCIVITIGLYGREIYDFFSIKMKNPVAFIREIRTGKDNVSDTKANIAQQGSIQVDDEPSKHD
jgi:hypothetical protein